MKTQTKCVPIFFVVTIHKSFWKTKHKFDNRNLDIDWIGEKYCGTLLVTFLKKVLFISELMTVP